MSGEADKHNWTAEEITALIEWRGANESVFTGKRNSSKSGWEAFVNQAEFKITDKQAKKKWNNLKEKYKELRDPPPGKGVEAVTAATWQWYAPMDAALQEQHSINPPLVAAANMTSTAGGVRASSAPARKRAKPAPRKRAGDLLDFLKMQAEKEEERESQALQREEERERAAAARSEKFLSLFEKLVDKL